MSRRVTLFVLAASAALIASPASADRECFENSCRLPGAVELSQQAEPAQEPQASAAPDAAQPELVRPNAAVPVKLLPASPVAPAAQAKAARQAAPVAPAAAVAAPQERDADSEDAPVAVSRAAPAGRARTERVAVPAPFSASGGYAMFGGVYAVAPSAKIITIDIGD